MRIKSIAVFLVYLLLLFSFTIPAVACCNPPCGDCYSCINGHCICTSECCSDSDCDNCYECVDCGCEHIDCDCDNCGNWGDHDDWCLESGEYCVGDKLTGGDITPPENGSAVCVGETIELTASDGSDSDCHYYNTDCCSGCSESVGDTDITISWSDNTLRDPCVAFPGSGGNPEGSSVDWLAPSGTGDVNITATWHNNTENKYPDGSESDVITVHVVDINSVTSDANATCIGCDITFTATTSPLGYENQIDISWTEGGEPESGSGSTFTTHWDEPGTYSVVASACDSNTQSNNVTVVEVASLLPDGGTEIDDGDGDPNTKSFIIYVAGEGVTTVTATSNPGIAEPNDLPDSWTLTGGNINDKLHTEVDKTTPAITTITCECSSSVKTTTIYVIEVSLKSVKFTSDHGVLKNNNSDWTDSGTTYVEPEWLPDGPDPDSDPDRNNPISHTKNVKLTTAVTVKVAPSGLTFDLIGNGPSDYVDFTKTGITSTGSEQVVTVDANAVLVNQVDTLTKSIGWTIKIKLSEQGFYNKGVGSSGPHKIYVTYGTPSGSVFTEKRMSWACQKADGQSTESGIADVIHNALGGVDPPYEPGEKPSLGNGWPILAGTTYGECDEQAELMELAVEILGVTGQLRLVRASTDSGAGNCLDYEDRIPDCNVHGAEKLLLDFYGGGTPSNMNQFEGCCETAGHYYAVWPKEKATNDYTMLQSLGSLGVTQHYCWWDDTIDWWQPCNEPNSTPDIP